MGLFSRSARPAKAVEATGARGAGGGQHRIDAGAVLTGDCRFGGRLEFGGQLRGSLLADPLEASCLVIAAGAVIHGRIEAQTIIIAGRVEGPVRADKSLEIRAGGRVIGDIAYRDLQICRGAVVEGVLASIDGHQVPLKLVANSRI